MCAFPTFKVHDGAELRQRNVVQTEQPRPLPAMHQAGMHSQNIWNDSSVTLVRSQSHTVRHVSPSEGSARLDVVEGCKTASETRDKHTKADRALVSRLWRDAIKADIREMFGINYFSNTEEGTKLSKLGVGQLILNEDLRYDQIFDFEAVTGGHRCLVCKLIFKCEPQPILSVHMSGEEAKKRGNYNNIVCSGDCNVRPGSTGRFSLL